MEALHELVSLAKKKLTGYFLLIFDQFQNVTVLSIAHYETYMYTILSNFIYGIACFF